MSPLVFFAGLFGLGCGAALLIRPPLFPAVLLMSLALAACFFLAPRPRHCVPLICLAFFLSGGVRTAVSLRPGASEISAVSSPVKANVIGLVREEPEAAGRRARFTVTVERAVTADGDCPCRGLILVTAEGTAGISLGDRVEVSGELIPCRLAFTWRKQRYADFLERHGIFHVMACKPWQVKSLEKNAGSGFLKRIVRFRKRLSGLFIRRLSGQTSAVMRAMVLGERKQVSPLLINAMIASGTIHILVVSGFNVGLVALVLFLLLRILRLPRTFRALTLIPCIFLYCLLTGASEPVVRAGIMAGVMACACLFQRDGDIRNAFALSLCVMLAINPRLLGDAGFQLSYASVFGLIILYPKLRKTCRLERVRNRFLRFLLDGFCVSFCAWSCTAGIVAYYFRIFSPGSVIINLLAAPLAGFITLCGFCMALAEMLLPFLTRFIAVTADYAIWLLIKTVSLKLPVFALP